MTALPRSSLPSPHTAACPAGSCPNDCPQLDLSGHCILFVGGRRHHAAHFRRLVEDCNGRFEHHDGGMEDNLGRLGGLFRRADAVLFPVDCVSHAAQSRVKQLCRQWEKPYWPLRCSGSGAFLKALESIAAKAAEATPA
jgi:hypothetical protein